MLSHEHSSQAHSHDALNTSSANINDAHQHSQTDHQHSHQTPTSETTDPTVTRGEDANDTDSAHRRKVIATFDLYLTRSVAANTKRKTDFYNLSKTHRDLLPDYISLINSVDEKLRINSKFIERIIEENPFEDEDEEESGLTASAPTEKDHEFLRSSLRQCVRDWSREGHKERASTYGPILDVLEDVYGSLDPETRSKINILVPGAGLGRLPWEIVKKGFSCQANEFSLYMLIASSFILNYTAKLDEFTIYPFLNSFSNIRNKSDLLTSYTIPDVLPSSISNAGGEMSFAAGDFLIIYSLPSSKGSWDVVATCFFIDTARNIVEYLEKIWWLLKDDGIWINNGPSLWHFEGNTNATSIDLTIEGIKDLSKRIGFKITDEKEHETTYTTNPVGLLKSQYIASSWVGRKS